MPKYKYNAKLTGIILGYIEAENKEKAFEEFWRLLEIGNLPVSKCIFFEPATKKSKEKSLDLQEDE